MKPAPGKPAHPAPKEGRVEMAICKLTKSEKAELQKIIDAYDAARSEIVDWLSNVQSEWESAIEDKSEKWKEGDAGQKAQGRLDTLSGWLDELPREQAAAGLRAVEAIDPLDATDIPGRIAYGEIEGQMLAAGRYNRRPAIQIRTHLYGFVWCVLSEALVARFGDEHKLAEVWEGKSVGVAGRLHYLAGGRLNQLEADALRIIEAPPFDLDAILDPTFTAGLDPVEYLNRLHERDLAAKSQ